MGQMGTAMRMPICSDAAVPTVCPMGFWRFRQMRLWGWRHWTLRLAAAEPMKRRGWSGCVSTGPVRGKALHRESCRPQRRQQRCRGMPPHLQQRKMPSGCWSAADGRTCAGIRTDQVRGGYCTRRYDELSMLTVKAARSECPCAASIQWTHRPDRD